MPRVLEFDREYTVVANDTLTAIIAAQCSTITFEEVAKFNWGGSDHEYVNRMLRETVGVKTLDAADSGLSVLDPAFGKTDKIRIPKLFVNNALPVEQTHTFTVKVRRPATAVAITALDKWFIPEDEVCDLTFRTEGIPERANKSNIEVFASNYCSTTAVEQEGLVSCTYTALDSLANPVWKSPDPVTGNKGTPKTDYPIADWRGESNATDGMLKPRAKSKQHINVNCSPYSVLVRYFKADGDKKAKVLIEPFWVEFQAVGGAPVPASLSVKWKAKDCAKLKHGQMIITDKDGTEVYYHALGSGDFSDGEHTNNDFKDAVAAGSVVLAAANMPYRVEVQGHSDVFEDDGLGISVKQTEVRLWVHEDVGTHAGNEVADPQCLKFGLAPFLPLRNLDSPAADVLPAEGSYKWYKLKLAEAGFHPGPVHKEATSDEFTLALKEFQRIHPRNTAAPFKRLECKGARNTETKTVLANPIAAKRRALFGASAGRADLLPAVADTTLNQTGQEIICWVDDRHYHTDPEGAKLPNKEMGLENYGGEMDPSEADRIANEEKSVARPWIPVAVEMALLSKADPLYATGATAMPAVTEGMRKAVGSLRVNWTFTELEPDESTIDSAFYNGDGNNWTRTLRFIREVIDGQGGGFKNCIAANAGIAQAPYYKQAFGHYDSGATTPDLCLAPWRADLDAGNQNVYSYAHSDIGQGTKVVHPPLLGKAGVYLHPSRIAGDGYRFRAQLSFVADPVAGNRNHPNRAALEKRYAKLPQAHTCGVRLWRKASFRAFVDWSPGVVGSTWPLMTNTIGQRYEPAFSHYVHESPAGAQVLTPFNPVTDSLQKQYRSLMDEYIGKGVGHRGWYPKKSRMQLNGTYFWPWQNEKHYGLPWRKAPRGTTATVGSWLTGGAAGDVKNDSSDLFRTPLILWVLSKAEEQTGLLAGHFCVRWNAVPQLWLRTYKCSNNHRIVIPERQQGLADAQDEKCPQGGCGRRLKKQYMKRYVCTNCGTTFNNEESDPAVDEWDNLDCPAAPTGCGTAGTITVDPTPQVAPAVNHGDEITERYNRSGLGGEPGVGTSMGSLWLYMADLNTNTRTCAHEFGHHRHLRHTLNATTGDTEAALSQHHDAVANPGKGGDPWCWRCMMSYAPNPGIGGGYDPLRFFCGRCALKLRGWRVMGLPAVGGGMADPVAIGNVSVANGARGAPAFDVDLTAPNANFAGGSAADFGPGVTVNNVTVTNATTVRVNITVQANAVPGPRTPRVTTGNEVAEVRSGFTVT